MQGTELCCGVVDQRRGQAAAHPERAVGASADGQHRHASGRLPAGRVLATLGLRLEDEGGTALNASHA